jgi:Zn-dependent protease
VDDQRGANDQFPGSGRNTGEGSQASVVEGSYIPPKRGGGNPWRGAGASAVGIGLILAKFKGLLFLLLSAKWFFLAKGIFISSFSFLASIWFYSLFFGWKFAAVFTVLILIHELGHTLAMRFFGVPSSLPYFIPGFGAFVRMKGPVASPHSEAYIALAGPFAGGLAALCCYQLGLSNGDHFWVAEAYTGFFLNAFNLLPIPGLDGSRVLAVLSPRLWIFGVVGLLAWAFLAHWWSPILLLLVLFSIPQAIAAWRGDFDARYGGLEIEQRIGVALSYVTVLWLLIHFMSLSHIPPEALHHAIG